VAAAALDAGGVVPARRSVLAHPEIEGHAVDQDDILFAGWQRLNYWEGDLCNVEVWISHFSGRELRDYVVEWNISDLGVAGVISPVSVERTDARPVGNVSFVVPPLDTALRSRLHLRLKDPQGRIVA